MNIWFQRMKARCVSFLTAFMAGAVLMGIWAAGSASAARPEPLPKAFDVYWDKTYRLAYDQALAGECRLLNAILNQPYKAHRDPSRLVLQGETYDRGVCAPLDPVKAFPFYQKAAEAWRSDWHSITAWKLWYGDGVVQDRKEARRQFREAVLYLWGADSGGLRALLRKGLNERPFPPPLVEVFEWLKTLEADEDRMLDWLVNLYRGTATYYDGSAIPAHPRAADYALHAIGSDRALFELADLIYRHNGTYDKILDAIGFIDRPARNGHEPSIRLLIEIYSDRRSGFYSEVSARVWTIVADDLGMDIGWLYWKQLWEFNLRSIRLADETATSILEELHKR